MPSVFGHSRVTSSDAQPADVPPRLQAHRELRVLVGHVGTEVVPDALLSDNGASMLMHLMSYRHNQSLQTALHALLAPWGFSLAIFLLSLLVASFKAALQAGRRMGARGPCQY